MCNINKLSISVNPEVKDTLLILVYGEDREYYPMLSDSVIKWFVSKIPIPIGNIEILCHLTTECDFILPTHSWIHCDFVEQYKKHCLEVFYKEKINSKYTITLNSQSIICGPYTIVRDEIKLNIFKILGEWYFKIGDKTVHITELDESCRNCLYKHLSVLCKIPIIEAKNFNPEDFSIELEDKIFLIPSIFNITNNTPLRSVYSQEERFKQTLEQVRSIYSKEIHACVFILELSYMSLRQIYMLAPYCRGIIFFNKDTFTMRYSVDPNKNKSEIYLQRFIYNKLHGVNYSHICKFGGRYKLSEKFSEREMFRDKPVFKHMESSYKGEPIYESIFYSIPHSYHDKFEKVLKLIGNTLNFRFDDVEHLLYKYIQESKIDVYHTDVLGVKGNFAGSGAYNSS